MPPCPQVYVPAYQYPLGVDVEVSRGHATHDPANQVLYWWHNAGPAAAADGIVSLVLSDPRNRPGSPAAETNGVDPAHAAGAIGAAERLARAKDFARAQAAA